MTPATWYARNIAGESFEDIAGTEGLTKGQVAGVIFRHRKANGLPPAPRKQKPVPVTQPNAAKARAPSGETIPGIEESKEVRLSADLHAKAQPKPATPKRTAVVTSRPAPPVKAAPWPAQMIIPPTPEAYPETGIGRFAEAAGRRGCLWIDGDLRQDTATVCGQPQEHGVYCAGHHARAHDHRPRKPVTAP